MIYLLESFYGGSHKQLIDLLQDSYECITVVLPAKKWHWRMRTGGLLLANQIDKDQIITESDVLFASSTFSLNEFLSIRPQFQIAKKILYFHENQLNYPVSKEDERDFQFGWIQITSCLVADVVLFNSNWNMTSFLDAIPSFINRTPDKKPNNVVNEISPKCRVLYYPIQMDYSLSSQIDSVISSDFKKAPLHIVWNHRWEYDKDPETFFSVILSLHKSNIPFSLSVLGESFDETPEIFAQMKIELSSHIINFGYMPTKSDYYRVLSEADVCVSTAVHEFFGVSVIEAAILGCRCICPNRLSYVELFPRDQLYNTPSQLRKMLKDMCIRVETVRNRNRVDQSAYYKQYIWQNQRENWNKLFLSII